METNMIPHVTRAGARTHRAAQGEHGFVIVLVGLLLIPLMAATAFAVDLGSWYAQAAATQRAADAAALAGVIWMPNFTKAEQVAQDVATRNGFENGVNATVTVSRITGQPTQLKVTISRTGNLFFGRLFTGNPTIGRPSTAQYVLPVPLGSPRNFLGTGSVGNGTGVYAEENLWMAISGPCTGKDQGDQVAARRTGGGNSCTGGSANPDFNATNYEYYIELPSGRTYDTDVLIYHGNFNGANGNAPITNEFAPSGVGSGDNGAMDTTFRLYKADGTPLDDSDNPQMSAGECNSGLGTSDGEHTFQGGNTNMTLDDNYNVSIGTGAGQFAVDSSFNNALWRLCRVSSGLPAGRYILRVTNTDLSNTQGNGSNAYSIVATPSSGSSPGPGFCDALSTATCPTVYAKDFMSVYARANGTAQFYLSEIGAEHAGKNVEVTLWDSAEGATRIRLLKPSGSSPLAWTYINFDYQVGTGVPVTNVDRINSPSFNGQLVTLRFNLPDNWDPPGTGTSENAWFRIEYTYGSSATDRTTWAVRIVGDPVHLVD